MKFLRYLLVQVGCYALDMGTFLILLYLGGLGPVISNIFAKTASGIFGYFAHRIFTFESHKGESHMRQAGLYFLLLGINVPTTSLILAALLYVIPYPELAKLISDVGFVFVNFWISKRFVFTHRGAAADAKLQDPAS